MGWKVRAYYNVNPFVGVSWHDTMVPIPLPPFMIPGKLPHIDFDVVQGLWLGCFLSNGNNRKILSDDLLMVGRMSDAGFIVPHISIPPSWFNILTTLFGSSNALFGTSSTTLACKNLLWGNDDCDMATSPFPVAPISLNLACWDPFSLPTDIVVLWGTVYGSMSFADLLAALIDFAIQLAMEGLMLIGGKLLQAGIKKMGESMAKRAAKNAGNVVKKGAGKGVKKGVFASLGDKIVTGFKKATGITASDGYKAYLKKAAKVKGIKSALDMSDSELATFVKKTGGFSDELSGVAENLTEGYAKFGKKYGKQVDRLNNIEPNASSDVRQLFNSAKRLGDGMVDDASAAYLAKNTLLKDALKELDTAVARVAVEEVVFQFELKLATKTLSSLYRSVVRNGNAFGTGTEGGIFSFGGAGWMNTTGRALQFKDRWSYSLANDLLSSSEEVTTTTTTTTTTEVTDDDDDDDYWFDGSSDEAAGSDDDDDDDDDYWYEITEVTT